MSYFTSFPRIIYNGNISTNITLRVKIQDTFGREATNFYPYTIQDGQTPENLSFDYYGSSEYSWLIYLCNDIIDPYYDWPISAENFDKYIAKKYGSVEAAREQVAYYKHDPYTYYININNNEFKMEADYDPAVDGVNWKKIEVDADTIRINSTSQTTIPYEYANIELGGDVSSSGSWFQPTLTYVSPSGSLTYLDSNVVIYENFDATEWAAVSCYEEEQDLNENKRYIRLLSRQFIPNVDRILRDVINA